MANNWTKDQQRAIDRSGRNILVSAAAGSGKTAVLVERIIKKITDEKNGTDIDRMVVVTFTKAAAAEMKQRIRESIDSILEKDPDNARLQRQLTLINNAQITTIDSFCLNIIRNYFTDIDLDPGFRTADDGEIQLLEHDVMEQLLEDYYSQADSDFFAFIDAYGTGRNDENVENIIHKLYSFARSYPWVDEWFDASLKLYQVSTEEELEQNEVICYLKDYVRRRMMDYDRKYTALEQICEGPQGPSMYTAAIQSDHSAIARIVEAGTFAQMADLVNVLSFDALGRKKVSDVSEEKKAYVKGQRDKYKEFATKTLKGKIFTKDISGLLSDIIENRKSVEMMIRLARDFTNRMAAEKRERNVIDFNDMEHMALNVLVHREHGVSTYTEASDILSSYYTEILIDEYQDSNMLQEVILTAVSKGRYDETMNNVYMVGDVKQSIYRFRMACPQLFMEKYNSYQGYDQECENFDTAAGTAAETGTVTGECEDQAVGSAYEKIELQANFRSRKNVLDSVNDVFKRAMNPDFTGVSYDGKAVLNAGFDYDAVGKNAATGDIVESDKTETDTAAHGTDSERLDFGVEGATEIMVVPINEEDEESSSPKVVQANAIAKRIKELLAGKDGRPYMVYDRRCSSGYRPIKYSDIVILLRTVTGWADTFVDELMNEGIPAYCDTSTGYFNVREIKLILNYLAVLDNPLQDVELAAVMLSYFGGFNTDELALIRVTDKNHNLYHIMKDENVLDGFESAMRQKIERFTTKIDEYRFKSEIMSIYNLLWEVLYNTGYYDYVGTMPAGSARQANLDLLLDRASSFEKTSYSGLFNFLRYVDRMQKFEVDFGEASSLGENDDLVRVMSIHKSKGLEFPVVFLAGMNKKINLMDAVGEVVVDQDYGIGTNVVNLNKRIKSPTCIKTAVSMKIKQESISEELRVLYVAMTRAREKLIMTGTVTAKSLEKQMQKWQEKSMEIAYADAYSYSDVAEFGNYFDIVMPVAYFEKEQNTGTFQISCDLDANEQSDAEANNEEANNTEENNTEANNAEANNAEVNNTEENNAEANNVKKGTGTELVQQSALESEREPLPDYPYATEVRVKSKITVSELKKMQHESDMDENSMYEDHIKEALHADADTDLLSEELIPKFIKGEETILAGSERGTAYHRIMECLNYSMTDSVSDIENCIDKMVQEEKLTQSQRDCVKASDVSTFVKTETGKRVKAAWENGCIYRESPFVYFDETVGMLVQGVIDLYIKEGDSLTIIDYKTDRVRYGAAGREELIKRYKVQLDYYAKALEQLTGLQVADKVIYSFQLGEDILI